MELGGNFPLPAELQSFDGVSAVSPSVGKLVAVQDRASRSVSKYDLRGRVESCSFYARSDHHERGSRRAAGNVRASIQILRTRRSV